MRQLFSARVSHTESSISYWSAPTLLASITAINERATTSTASREASIRRQQEQRKSTASKGRFQTGSLWQVTWLVVTVVRSESLERRHDIGVLCTVSHIAAYWTSPVCVTSNFSSSSVVSRAFSALCARYACIRRSGIILTPGLTGVEFCFCRLPPLLS